MVSVEIYIKVDNDFKRIDLFNSEKISITSSVQNINDLGKAFTDYSQSFTVPASKNNNTIFNRWNDNSIDNSFDHRRRYDAKIELNTIPFREGQIQIEKANEKDNNIDSYTITFYGNVKQLKDIFGDLKLNTIDLSAYNFNYTPDEVKYRIGGSDSNVFFPICGSQTRYEYLTGTPNDITGTGYVIWNELFPAVPLPNIINALSTAYGITFTGSFLNSPMFTKLCLYLKNDNKLQSKTESVLMEFTGLTDGVLHQDFSQGYTNPPFASLGTPETSRWESIYLVITSGTSDLYDIEIYKDGILNNTVTGLLGNTNTFIWSSFSSTTSHDWYFKIKSDNPITISSEILYTKKIHYNTGSTQSHTTSYLGTSSTSSNLNLNQFIPDMKIIDLLNGLIKMFNLVILPQNNTTFELIPLEWYYQSGNYHDINSYVINDSTDFERPKLYKKIEFKHQKSENILNQAFSGLFAREYGDLLYTDPNNNESQEYTIESPFEDIMWERTTGTNFQTASFINFNLQSYKPKPILMYFNDIEHLGTTFNFNNGSSLEYITDYVRFNNDFQNGSDVNSLNFSNEISSWFLDNNNLSLFDLWYRNYIAQLYDLKCRIVKLKAVIPSVHLADYKLNDRIIYKDKKYIINTFTSDLTSGEVDFELITDFRPVQQQASSKMFYRISAESQEVGIDINILNKQSFDFVGSFFLYNDNTESSYFNITFPSNTTGDVLTYPMSVDYSDGTSQTLYLYQDA